MDKGMIPPDEHGPKNPSAKLTGLPHSPDRTAALAESPSWHKTVAQLRHLVKDGCSIRENEGLDHEAKRVVREPNPEEERELLATPEGLEAFRRHYIEISRSTPHLEVDLIPTRVWDIAPHLIAPLLTPVERADFSHLSHRYGPSLARLLDADRSQGQETPELLPGPSLSPGRMSLSIKTRHQDHAYAVTEVSASFDICNGAPALSRRKRLQHCQRTPSEKGKIPVVSYPVLDSRDEEVIENESEDDNCSEVFTDADSGSYNDPGSSKSASHNS